MSEIKVTISVEVIGEKNVTFKLSDETQRHVGGNPLFLAQSVEEDIDHVRARIVDVVTARFGDVRK